MASNDDLTPALVQEQARRPDPDAAELDRRMQLLMQQEHQPAKAEPVKPDPQGDAVRATLTPGAGENIQWGATKYAAKEVGKVVVGGVRDAGQQVLNFVDDTSNWVNDNWFNLRTDSQQAAYDQFKLDGKRSIELPDVPANETTAGQLGRGVTQFVVPFLGWLKAVSRAGQVAALTKTAEGMAAGAITDATSFDPHESRLSNMILQWTDGHPPFADSLFNYLAAKPGDTNAEGRLKRVAEGLFAGAGAEMVLRSLKLLKALAISRGQDPTEVLTRNAPKVEIDPATGAPKEAAAAPEATPKPAESAAKPVDQVKPVADEPRLFEDMHQPLDAEAAKVAPSFEASLKRPEVAGIAPKARFGAAGEALDIPAKALPRIGAKQVDEIVANIKEGKIADVAKQLDESDFNLSKIDTPDQVKELVDGFSKVFERQYDAAKHGEQSFASIKELAQQLGAGQASLRELYQGTDNLAAKVFAHRTLLAASAEKVNSLIPAAINGDANAILALRKHVALHASIQGQIKGVQTEVARALGQFRIKSSAVDLAINERNALIEAMGGHEANMDFANKLSQITDPTKFNEVTRRAALARSPSALFEAWVNGLLSSPVTLAANGVGNALVALGSVAERAIGSGIGTARALVLRDPQAAIQAGEVKAYTLGLWGGLKDALHISADGLRTMREAYGSWRTGTDAGREEARRIIAGSDDMGNMWKTLATDSPVLDNAAFGTRQFELQTSAITADNLPRLTALMGRSMVEYMGALVRMPGRALASTDELFKTMLYRGELHAQAYRKAATEGLDGSARNSRIAELLNDPTPDISGASLKAAREGTFTSPLGKSGNSLQSFIANTPGLRYIMPFVRTPINMMKYTYDRTPFLNLMQEQNRSILAAGGPQADMLMSKWAMGGSLFTLASVLSAQGIITGGGMEKERNAEQLGGEGAYSFHLGDKYYSFSRLDPIGMIFGLAADFQKISGHLGDTEKDKLAAAAVLSISKNLASKSYLSGVIDAIDTFNSNSAGKWQKYVNKQAGTMVPGFLAQVRKEVDPEVKEVWGMMDAIKSRIPGLSKSVKPHVNLLGEDVHYEGGLGPDIASPVAQMTENPDPGAKEVARLNVDLKHPLRTIGSDGGTPGVELNGDQYYRLMKILGKEAGGVGFKKALNDLIASPAYKALPEDPHQRDYKQIKQKEIELVYDGMKRASVMQLISEDKDLREKFMQNLKNKGNALMGLPISPVK